MRSVSTNSSYQSGLSKYSVITIQKVRYGMVKKFDLKKIPIQDEITVPIIFIGYYMNMEKY